MFHLHMSETRQAYNMSSGMHAYDLLRDEGNVECLPVRVGVLEQLVATLSWNFGQAGSGRLMRWRLHSKKALLCKHCIMINLFAFGALQTTPHCVAPEVECNRRLLLLAAYLVVNALLSPEV